MINERAPTEPGAMCPPAQEGGRGSSLDLNHVTELGPLVNRGDFPASRLWES